eukprot:32978_1
MINLLEESVRTAAKEAISEQLRMDWSDSVFRPNPKYYGDVEFTSKDHQIIGDHGLVSSKKYLAFRHASKIGILSTAFDSNIEEKLASGRKAEYGSKVYTTRNIDSIDIDEKKNINVLQFSKYNDDWLFAGDASGTLSIFNLSSVSQHNTVLSAKVEATERINCIAQHPSCGNLLAIGGSGNVSLIDIGKGGSSLISTAIMDGSDDIVSITYSENANYLRGVTRDKKWLFTYDPRCDKEISNAIELHYTPHGIVNLYGENEIAVGGLTSYLEPIVTAYDISGGLSASNVYDSSLFKQNWKHKHCIPMMIYDRFTQLLYVTFRGCSDLLSLNTSNEYAAQAVYHAQDDVFEAFDLLPKHACKKRQMNGVISFSKHRIQQIVHNRGGKLIYSSIASKAKESICRVEDYMSNANVAYPDDDIGKCMAQDYEEEKKRSVSVYTHVTGKEAQNASDKYFDLKLSQTVNCNLGLNLKSNGKYALFPCPTYGGGGLGIIELSATGRKKQGQLSGHSSKISTFDVSRINEDLVLTGSPDCKAMIWRIKEGLETKKVFTLQCVGKVTFVSFHPRINGLCVVAAAASHSKDCLIYFYDYTTGRVIDDDPMTIENASHISDICFETVRGLIAAVSCSGGQIQLIDIGSRQVVRSFECNHTSMRDTKLFWACSKGRASPATMNQLVCVGFGKGSVRKFALYDVSMDDEEEKEGEIECIGSMSFGVSNAIPIAHYDCNDNLLYVSSIGDRKIRCFELNTSSSIIHEVNASYQSKTDIQGMSFISKQSVDVSKVEIARCLKLTKDGEIAPVSFYIPRKRMQYFQDDIYSDVLDATRNICSVDHFLNKHTQPIVYVSLKPHEMHLLSQAPPEELTTRQKRRKSQVEAMEANKLKQIPQSTEQAFDQFSRMVADAPTANRWDAQNIGTEVADDEWDD